MEGVLSVLDDNGLEDLLNKLNRARENILKEMQSRKQKQHRMRPEVLTELKRKALQRRQHIDNLAEEHNNLEYYNIVHGGRTPEFTEWLRQKKEIPNQERINEFLNSIKPNSIIDFQQLSTSDKEAAFQQMKEKLQKEIGELAITERFKINYRVNGNWKSRTLTPEVFNSLMNSLDEQEFVYSKEVFQTNEVRFSDDGEFEYYKLSHFDAISFTPISESGSQRKDPRDSFFPYLNKSDIDLSRYQIFPTLFLDDKNKQREELNDSCFIYAMKVAGVDEDTLNKMRIQIHTRKFGLSKMDEICAQYDLHVIVHDLEVTNKNSLVRVNNKNYFGTEHGQHIELNSFKGHYFIQEKTKYSFSFIKHKYILKEDVDEENYNKTYEDGKWKNKKDSKRFITSGHLIKLLIQNRYFEPIT